MWYELRLPADSRCRLGLVIRVAGGGCGKPTVGVWVRPECVKGVRGYADGVKAGFGQFASRARDAQ